MREPRDHMLAKARTEASYSHADRRYGVGNSRAHRRAVRAYHRAARRWARNLCRAAKAAPTH